MPQGIRGVRSIDPASGSEHWVRIQARGREEARDKVTALGEVVGEVRQIELIEGVDEPAPTRDTDRRSFSVEFVHRETGERHRVVNDAPTPEAAAHEAETQQGAATVTHVVVLGKRLSLPPDDGGGNPSEWHRSVRAAENAAWAVGLLGLIIPIGGPIAWIWGARIMTRSGDRYGRRHRNLGAAITILGLVLGLLVAAMAPGA